MEVKKVVVFIVRGIEVETLNADETTPNEIEGIKCSLAVVHEINYHEIEVITKDTYHPELSETLIVRSGGGLMKRMGANTFFTMAEGVRPAFDLTKEELRDEFIELISKKDIDNAFIFI